MTWVITIPGAATPSGPPRAPVVAVVAVALPCLLSLAALAWALGPRRLPGLVPMLLGAMMGVVVIVVVLPRSVAQMPELVRTLRQLAQLG